ncbi:hypothetical protein BV898_19326 [Hypsibius exemplaris]|uniref:K Homology domain-containing protein n=1 Tax=Hypsibius exemplaris TaxID=2072580 RepID=A0A9X6NS04_HYPEX|nr:hypothetical protein BV898_19326 [Hypsibius exemplaris]
MQSTTPQLPLSSSERNTLSCKDYRIPEYYQCHEIIIPNDWVGCMIGRGGVKINEIHHLSGAMINISPCEAGKKERNIRITGSTATVNVVLYLIQTRISAELLTSGGLL